MIAGSSTHCNGGAGAVCGLLIDIEFADIAVLGEDGILLTEGVWVLAVKDLFRTEKVSEGIGL